MKKAITRVVITMLVLMNSLSISGQSSGQNEDVVKQVFEMLSGDGAEVKDVAANLPGAWESLAYIEESDSLQISDLQEAVPDYYHFRDDNLVLKLINPENYNEYGFEMTIKYVVGEGNTIRFMDPETGAEKDTWVIIYLDANYLAVDMGDLRVFMTATAPQE